MSKHPDRIIVKVYIKAPDTPNNSNIKKEWHDLLQGWVDDNDCDIDRIEWTRLRHRKVSDPSRSHDELYWDKIEESK